MNADWDENGQCLCTECCEFGHCPCETCDEPCDCPADEEVSR